MIGPKYEYATYEMSYPQLTAEKLAPFGEDGWLLQTIVPTLTEEGRPTGTWIFTFARVKLDS